MKHTTNCITYNRTSYKNCSLSDIADKKRWYGIDGNLGKCKRSDNHYDWKSNKNLSYIIEHYENILGLETKYDNKFIEFFEIYGKFNKSINELKRKARKAKSNQKIDEYIIINKFINIEIK